MTLVSVPLFEKDVNGYVQSSLCDPRTFLTRCKGNSLDAICENLSQYVLSSTDATVPLEPFFQFPGEQLGIVYPRKMPLENIIRNMYKHVHKRFCVAVTSECIKPKGVSVQVYGEPIYEIADEFLEQLTPNVQQIVCDSEFTPGKVPLANTYKGHRFVFSYAFLA